MESFRGLVDHFLLKAEELCADLLFNLDLVVNLTKIKDNITNV